MRPLPGSRLYENMHRRGFVDLYDHFRNSRPESEWKIGLGTREYELIVVK